MGLVISALLAVAVTVIGAYAGTRAAIAETR
jgi:hypothetical protein